MKDPNVKNVEMTVNGTTLAIQIDLTGEIGPSKSGKSVLVATTAGAVEVFDTGLLLTLTLYRPNK